MRVGVGILIVIFATSVAHAQDVVEVWPELDVYWQQAAHQRNMFELSASSEREGSKREATIGAYQDYLQLPGAFYRGGLRYTFSVRDASYRELRAVLEANLAAYKIGRYRAINRSRVELRDVNNAFSWRFRDRVHVQRYPGEDAKPPAWAPYGTFEAYYDSRYRTISRLGARAGVEARVNRIIGVDVYVARQDNSRGEPAVVDALGVSFKLSYR